MKPESAVPGETLFHPLVLGAAALIFFNSFWLKVHHPGWWSGKLSDVGLCIFLPVWLFALMEWGSWFLARLQGRAWQPLGQKSAMVACVVAGGYFTALQVIPGFSDFHIWWLGLIFSGTSFVVTPDWTDLITLPFLAAAYWVMRNRQ